MPRKTDKRERIVRAAADAFAIVGYKRTQMADIARRADVALGTLYSHCSSKDELFLQALVFGLDGERVPETLPTHSGRLGEILAEVIRERASRPAVTELARGRVALARLVGELFDGIVRQRYAIRMIDRSAHDWPEVAELYVDEVREPTLRRLVGHLETLQRRGRVRRLPNVEASARFVLEVCAWFAMHRLFSPGGTSLSDDEARSVTVDHVARSLAAPSSAEATP